MTNNERLLSEKVICKHCKGTGRVFDHEDGIISFGIDYLFQMWNPKIGKKNCPRCNGTGEVTYTEYQSQNKIK